MSDFRLSKQSATKNILLRVTNVCSVCFHDLLEGDVIYYDNEHYRYICETCAEQVIEEMKQEEEELEGGAALFG